jgi:hypothetical protein
MREQSNLASERDRAQWEREQSAAQPAAPPRKWEPSTFDEWKEMEDHRARVRAKYSGKGGGSDGEGQISESQALNLVQDFYGLSASEKPEGTLEAYVAAARKGGIEGIKQYEEENGPPKLRTKAPDETAIFTDKARLSEKWNAWLRNEQTRTDQYGTIITGEVVPPTDARTQAPIDPSLFDDVSDVAVRQNKDPQSAADIVVATEISEDAAARHDIDDVDEPLFDSEEVEVAMRSIGVQDVPALPKRPFSLKDMGALVVLGYLDEPQLDNILRRLRGASAQMQRAYQGTLGGQQQPGPRR